MPKRQKRILLALGWYDCRLHDGIAQYAVERGWHLCPHTTKEKVIPWGWEGDGVLAWLGVGDDLAEFVVHAHKPTVDFGFRRPQLPFPRVLADQAGAANLAAEHFLSRGFSHFIFYSEVANWAYEEDGRAFVQAVERAGRACAWLRWQRKSGDLVAVNHAAAPHVDCRRNTGLDVDLTQYTRGFTNGSPAYAVFSSINGSVTLVNGGRTARFTPTADFYGLGGFDFEVTDASGFSYTNHIGVDVRALPQSHFPVAMTNNIPQLNFIGELGFYYLIQYSDGLATWTTWTNIRATASATTFTTPGFSYSTARFFRAVSVE